MTQKTAIRLFLAVVILYFAAMVLNHEGLQFVFKPLLITTLLAYFFAATGGFISMLKILTAGALVFSIGGDTLLMFAAENELFFLLGLSSFLIAHLIYIVIFNKIQRREKLKTRWQWAIIVEVYYLFIIGLLFPHLGGMKIPVMVYGLTISFMLLTAMLLYELSDNKTARYILTGAILFVISDSVLAINKFLHPFELAGWVIMITYISAQFLIVKGMVRYIRSVNN